MAEEWIVRVQGKEYGPASLQVLQEWKLEGRVLAGNEARPTDSDVWATAAQIPGLFEPVPPPQLTPEIRREARGLFGILAETLRIYFTGFRQFFCLTLLVLVPSLCAQLTGAALESSPNVDMDLRTLLAGGFAFCMVLLGFALWPIYIAGIQILTAERAAGRRLGFFALLNVAVKYWPRVALLCVVVYIAFFLLMLLGLAIALMIVLGATSFAIILFALFLLAIQVWLFGRLFINVMFWQQAAVLDDAPALESLRLSKELARSGDHLSWYRRPLWRGVFVASLWCAFVLALTVPPEWQNLSRYFHEITSSHDPQTLLQTLQAHTNARGFNLSTFGIGLLQTILRPLLGIAFVLLYFETKAQGTAKHSPSGED